MQKCFTYLKYERNLASKVKVKSNNTVKRYYKLSLGVSINLLKDIRNFSPLGDHENRGNTKRDPW